MGRKIYRAKVMASLTTECPKCRYQIPPDETQRVSFTEMRCPKCLPPVRTQRVSVLGE